MRMPRSRFTIGGLMVAVLAAGLAFRVMSVRLSIREQQAQASYQQARLVREVAEYALKEYREGVYEQQKSTYLGQIALAEAERDRILDRLKSSSRRHTRTLLWEPSFSFVSDQIAKQQADFDLEQARMQLNVLERYTKGKMIASLQADIAKARADEQAKLANWQMEQAGRRWMTGF